LNIIFSERSFYECIDWQTKDKKIVKKINELIKDIQRNGMLKGIGQPELLKHGLTGYYSRKINEEHRLVYAMDTNNNLVIVKCKDHY
jgi:toxin YoeB